MSPMTGLQMLITGVRPNSRPPFPHNDTFAHDNMLTKNPAGAHTEDTKTR